jgi:hypothetical protein
MSLKLTLLSSVEESSILGRVTDLNNLCSREQLHDKAGSDYGRDAQFHQCAAVRGQNDADPVERIGRVGAHDSKQWNLKMKMLLVFFMFTLVSH